MEEQTAATDKATIIDIKNHFVDQCRDFGGSDCIRRGKFETWEEGDEWRGVEFKGGRVTRLSLDDRQLVGPIPWQLGNLGELTFLNLSGNQLSGEIPAQLGHLKKLDTLALNDNKLEGAIPPELSNLLRLHELYLQNNLLEGRIPLELTALSYSYLRKMDLDREGSSSPVGGCLPPNGGFVRAELISSVGDAVATTAATWSVGTVRWAAQGVVKAANVIRISHGAAIYAPAAVNIATKVSNVAKTARVLGKAYPKTTTVAENFTVAVTENVLGAFAGPVGKGFTLDIDISESIAEGISRVAQYFGWDLGGKIEMDKVYCKN